MSARPSSFLTDWRFFTLRQERPPEFREFIGGSAMSFGSGGGQYRREVC
jgi:hypothetical protein